jgi:1-phosphofructokinase family hexose kinase
VIVTLTLNPAVDQTLWVARFAVGEVNRPSRVQLDPAGKGVNAARIAHRLGESTLALGIAAGHLGDLLDDALRREGVPRRLVRVAGETRMNVTIVPTEGCATSLYGPGPPLPAIALDELDTLVDGALERAEVLVLSGSLLPGAPNDLYARWIERARRRGVRTILDASGAALRMGALARPDVIKPNLSEAATVLGRPLSGDDVAAAALELRARGIDTVIVSQGARGAICASAEGLLRVVPPTVPSRSTVGSGDAMVGGYAVALVRGEGIAARLRLGTAAGAATAAAEGTSLGQAAEIARLLPEVRVEALG